VSPHRQGPNLSRRIAFSLVVRSVDLSLVDMRDHSSELPELWDIDRLVAYLGTSQHLVYCRADGKPRHQWSPSRYVSCSQFVTPLRSLPDAMQRVGGYRASVIPAGCVAKSASRHPVVVVVLRPERGLGRPDPGGSYGCGEGGLPLMSRKLLSVMLRSSIAARTAGSHSDASSMSRTRA
jgi:hypothetical protein